jgi:Flp pilus assembly protein TadG
MDELTLEHDNPRIQQSQGINPKSNNYPAPQVGMRLATSLLKPAGRERIMKAKCIRLWTRGRARWACLRAERGTTTLEFALVVPVLFTLLLGIFWMGRAYNVYATITRAAREGARYGAAPWCATCANAGTFPSSTDVQTVVNGALSAAALDPTQVLNFTYTTGVQLNGVDNPYPACPSPLSPTQECGVVVSFQYPVTLVIPFTSLKGSTINIPTSVQMRQEN